VSHVDKVQKVYISAHGPLDSDPELEVGGVVWLERSDGRSVWRQQFKCIKIEHWQYRGPSTTYVLEPT
jgi:hypothetical protein